MQKTLSILLLSIGLLMSQSSSAQDHSVAHKWTEANLNSIRNDFARPPQTARTLWQLSIGMYDAWAAYDSLAIPYFLGNGLGDVDCPFGVMADYDDSLSVIEAQEMAISYFAFNFIKTRYDYNDAQIPSDAYVDSLMNDLGYDLNYTSTDYASGDPRALGNYIAQRLLAAALLDGSNEGTGDINGYQLDHYLPVNTPLDIQMPDSVGNPNIDSLNRYQPINFLLFCDQVAGDFTNWTPPFIGAEWGHVVPFALKDEDKVTKTRDGDPYEWPIFHDPGAPPHIDDQNSAESQFHQWNMDIVLKWSEHLTPLDTTTWDISPGSIGNMDINNFPTDWNDYASFYDFENGGDPGTGHAINPYTNMPYTPQMIRRGDYARILAEFWADGPDSETPPGHWYRIYNEIKYHPDFSWKWKGQGDSIPQLEYDLRTYFTLGASLHDAAIACWSVKGYYDYVRPVSTIRARAELGQISDPGLPNYDPTGRGLPLIPGWIEMIMPGDTVAGENDMYLYELKVMSWLGPLDEDTCIAGLAPVYHDELGGVGWKLALDWWPYQRPTFITPAFAGYVSGHSTFSRAAAEVMTLMTGDAYFPGGMAEFYAPQNQYLVFEEGPSEDVYLQWATYQDAADQCSLSRIWGGIHPPIDDIPGRRIGYEVGHDVFPLAESYFFGGTPELESLAVSDLIITDADAGANWTISCEYSMPMDTLSMPTLEFDQELAGTFSIADVDWTSDTTVVMSYTVSDAELRSDDVNLTIKDTPSKNGVPQADYTHVEMLLVDTENPSINALDLSSMLVDGSLIGDGTFTAVAQFSEAMNTDVNPVMSFPLENPSNVLTYDPALSNWTDPMTYSFYYDVENNLVILDDVDVQIGTYSDSLGNPGLVTDYLDLFDISVVTSLTEEELQSQVILFPNPLRQGQPMRLRSDVALSDVEVSIHNAIGQQVSREYLGTLNREVVSIPTAGLDAGTYLVTLAGAEARVTMSLIILDN